MAESAVYYLAYTQYHVRGIRTGMPGTRFEYNSTSTKYSSTPPVMCETGLSRLDFLFENGCVLH